MKSGDVQVNFDEYPFLKWLHADEFPVGAFAILCAIMGGVCNYWTGLVVMNRLGWNQPNVLGVWILLGIGWGIAIAIKFICWLADRS